MPSLVNMGLYSSLVALTLATLAAANPTQYTATASKSIAAARATALTLSPTSSVSGKTFDRFVTIWLENTDYSAAAGDSTFRDFSSRHAYPLKT
jgi:hypothetical protein